MPAPSPVRRPIVLVTAATFAAAAAGASIGATAALASPDGDGVVISEAYGGGGNSGATYTNDFVELYNPTDVAISLDGWKLAAGSAGGANLYGDGAATLSGSIPAKGHYLVEAAEGNAGTEPLPEPDAVVDWAMGGTGFKVLLVDDAADAPTSIPAGDLAAADIDGYVDGLGAGSSANAFETSAAPAPSNTASVSRSATGEDTDDNAADFTAGDPTPESTATGGTTPPTSTPPTSTPPADLTTIAEIQGDGAESPLVGETVTTRGWVTASYPEGGKNGIVIQEPGTPSADATASTGLFVYRAEAEIGDYIEVTGEVSEYYGLTELTASGPVTSLPAEGVDPAESLELAAWPGDDAARERIESMLVEPAFDSVVSENYDLNRYGELTLAAGTGASAGTGPLLQPTEVGAPGSAEADAQTAENDARRVILDDGRSTQYTSDEDATTDIPLPYVTLTTPVTVGASVAFDEPVVIDYGFGSWILQPTRPVSGLEHAPATFGDVREAAPAEVGGDIRIATFNVLNYFTALGVDHCTPEQSYTDREGNPITANGCLPRGAWDAENLARQQAKIVNAINTLDADVVALEEIEASDHFGPSRDESLATLVDALNDAAGTTRWAYAPAPVTVPATGDDVIRTAFIYRPDAVEPSGDSTLLDDEAFVNARAPLAQAFVANDDPEDRPFVVIANHFKSKGSGDDATGDNADLGDGAGAWNGDRTRQAQALVEFSAAAQREAGTDLAFLVGDFNAYAEETPVTTIAEAGYRDLAAGGPEYSYSYDGTVGSLDHIFASPAAADLVTGNDIWTINAYEPVALEYSRYNYNIENYYDESVYRSSDHNPVIVGVGFGDEDAPGGSEGDEGSESGEGDEGDAEAGANDDEDRLAFTGSETAWGAGVVGAGVLLVVGGALALRRRRGSDV